MSPTPDTSATPFDYSDVWDTAWDDMNRHGPLSRHTRRCIKKMIEPLLFDSVLDVGCGQALLLGELLKLYPHIRPFGTEIAPSGLKRAQQNLPQGTFYALDASREHLDQKFDLVICSEVLEHIPDDRAVLRNLRAMTGKYLVVSTQQGRMRYWEPEMLGHVRNYAYGELVQKMRESGFRVVRVFQWGFPFHTPLYRTMLEITGSKGSWGKFGLERRIVTEAIHLLFFLNSFRRGDEIVVLAEPTDQGQS